MSDNRQSLSDLAALTGAAAPVAAAPAPAYTTDEGVAPAQPVPPEVAVPGNACRDQGVGQFHQQSARTGKSGDALTIHAPQHAVRGKESRRVRF